jgi:hypothetical protein
MAMKWKAAACPSSVGVQESLRLSYHSFYVGTKAFLLSDRADTDLREYLKSHPGLCSQGDSPITVR